MLELSLPTHATKAQGRNVTLQIEKCVDHLMKPGDDDDDDMEGRLKATMENFQPFAPEDLLNAEDATFTLYHLPEEKAEDKEMDMSLNISFTTRTSSFNEAGCLTRRASPILT